MRHTVEGIFAPAISAASAVFCTGFWGRSENNIDDCTDMLVNLMLGSNIKAQISSDSGRKAFHSHVPRFPDSLFTRSATCVLFTCSEILQYSLWFIHF